MLIIPHKLGIGAILGKKLGMCATFRNLAVVEHDDFIAITYGRQTMRYHDARDTTVANALYDFSFGLSIKRAGSFIQDDDGRILREHAGDFEPLQLSAAEVAPFGQHA